MRWCSALQWLILSSLVLHRSRARSILEYSCITFQKETRSTAAVPSNKPLFHPIASVILYTQLTPRRGTEHQRYRHHHRSCLICDPSAQSSQRIRIPQAAWPPTVHSSTANRILSQVASLFPSRENKDSHLAWQVHMVYCTFEFSLQVEFEYRVYGGK